MRLGRESEREEEKGTSLRCQYLNFCTRGAAREGPKRRGGKKRAAPQQRAGRIQQRDASQCTTLSALKLLLYAPLSYYCMRPEATSVRDASQCTTLSALKLRRI